MLRSFGKENAVYVVFMILLNFSCYRDRFSGISYLSFKRDRKRVLPCGGANHLVVRPGRAGVELDHFRALHLLILVLFLISPPGCLWTFEEGGVFSESVAGED